MAEQYWPKAQFKAEESEENQETCPDDNIRWNEEDVI